ncbi:MAG: hypothetical protein AB8B79_05265 [Granulosicoccus sp.]
MINLRKKLLRGCLMLAVAGIAVSSYAATESKDESHLPKNPDALVSTIRQAIEESDYDKLKELVFWKDAGKIKKRVVRFQLNRSLGRPLKSVTFEDFPENGLAAAEATGKLEVNMPVTNRVRVIFDEEPINDAGKLPTAVFVVGKKRGSYRIALVVRKGFIDDDGD